jgi:formimidoylglutamate deiminase
MKHPRKAWLPDLLWTGERFESDIAIVCDDKGKIVRLANERSLDCDIVRLRGRAVLPGLVNGHSHAFQRVIRGRTEYRSAERDSFWTWREMMYAAATRLSPDQVFTASRMAFYEMALSGITSVGEFHYLHNAPDGSRYEDPNLLAKQVIAAAREVGIRITMLRVAYARSGFNVVPNPRQLRFIENDPQAFLRAHESLTKDAAFDVCVKTGIAPHSVRAVPLDYLRILEEFAAEHGTLVHMHVAEQKAELDACRHEYGTTPVELLAREGLLNERFTGVHAVHITEGESRHLARAKATVCACPTTERNLGDGVVPADRLFEDEVPISLGTDSQTQIDLLEDARELEYHLRLEKQERAVLAGKRDSGIDSPARRLFECTTLAGARSIGHNVGLLEPGREADFFSIDLSDPSIAGWTIDSLLANIVFGLNRTAIRDVVVGGNQIVSDGLHPLGEEIIHDFVELQRNLWL